MTTDEGKDLFEAIADIFPEAGLDQLTQLYELIESRTPTLTKLA